jgi:hypothetical protein
VEKEEPRRGGASKPGLGHAGAGGRRYVTAVGQGGLESGVGTQHIDSSDLAGWRRGEAGRPKRARDREGVRTELLHGIVV